MSSSGTLRCTLPEEVLLLLKSSDFIVHDLMHALNDTVDPPSRAFDDFQVEKAVNATVLWLTPSSLCCATG